MASLEGRAKCRPTFTVQTFVQVSTGDDVRSIPPVPTRARYLGHGEGTNSPPRVGAGFGVAVCRGVRKEQRLREG